MESVPLEVAVEKTVSELCFALGATTTDFFSDGGMLPGPNNSPAAAAIIPTGAFACGLWSYGEDIRLVCMANNSPEIFWERLKENLSIDANVKVQNNEVMELSSMETVKKCPSSHNCLRDFVRLSRRNNAGCKFYLHYCRSQYFGGSNIDLISESNLKFTSKAQIHHLGMVRDIQMLSLKFNQHDESFRRALIKGFRSLRCWAKLYGLIGPGLGFFDSNKLIWLLHGDYLEDWSRGASVLAARSGGSLLFAAMRRVLNEAFTDLVGEAQSDMAQMARRCQIDAMSPEARTAVQYALRRSGDSVSITDVVVRDNDIGFREFLNDFDYFLKVHCECWRRSLDLRTAFQELVVPDNLNKIVAAFRDKETNLYDGKISLRIWPVPIFATDDQRQQVYAIAVRQSGASASAFEFVKKRGDAIAHEVMSNILDYNYDQRFISVELVNSQAFESDLVSMRQRTDPGNEIPNAPHSESDRHALNGNNYSRKFRTAGEAIKKLRWDEKHKETEYQVGYVDRFKEDLQWMSLELWGGKETEEIDFIPEHRVRQLRKADDLRVVWDREKRIELL